MIRKKIVEFEAIKYLKALEKIVFLQPILILPVPLIFDQIILRVNMTYPCEMG